MQLRPYIEKSALTLENTPTRTVSTHTMSAIHQSAPLDLGSSVNIRLLRLELDLWPVWLTPIISVRLHVTSLEDAPHYTAVSYVWGEPSPTSNILLNRKVFSVRQNLWDLLSRLRAVHFDGYLWIDTLSIDQTSDSEKNHQVAIMGSIYTNAETTIAWFGTANEEVAENIRALNRKLKMARFNYSGRMANLEVTGFKYILAHPYWTRTWILQEYILSPQVELWCGDEILGSAKLDVVADSWVDTMASLYETSAQTSALAIIIHGAAYGVKRYTLCWLLNLSSDSACLDPRDRIYALLSLMSPRERDLWDITPDYAASTQDLFEHLCSVFRDTDKDVGRWVWTFEQWKERLRRILLLDAVEKDGQDKACISGTDES